MTYLAAAIILCGSIGFATSTSAHAFLEHATPSVGGTVEGSPSELVLSFTQEVEAPLSRVTIAAVAGGSIAVSKPAKDQTNQAVLHVRLGRALAPGIYVVNWHVVSVDTHPTSGSYKFTVAP